MSERKPHVTRSLYWQIYHRTCWWISRRIATILYWILYGGFNRLAYKTWEQLQEYLHYHLRSANLTARERKTL